jgi:hypothetical protein
MNRLSSIHGNSNSTYEIGGLPPTHNFETRARSTNHHSYRRSLRNAACAAPLSPGSWMLCVCTYITRYSCEPPSRLSHFLYRQSSSRLSPPSQSFSSSLDMSRTGARPRPHMLHLTWSGPFTGHSHRRSMNSSRRLRKLTYRQMIFMMQRLYQIYIEQNRLLLGSHSLPPYHSSTMMVPPPLLIYPSQLIGTNS